MIIVIHADGTVEGGEDVRDEPVEEELPGALVAPGLAIVGDEE